MSIHAIDLVFHLHDSRLSSSDKFVLLALADNANEETGLAWPSIKTLVNKTAQDRKTVQSTLQRLVERGFLEDSGKRVGKTKSIKVYRLLCVTNKSSSEAEAIPKTGALSDPKFPLSSPKNGMGKQSQKRDTEPLLGTVKESKSTKLSEVIESLKEDPRYDGLDIDLELEKAVAWRKKKNMGVSERFLRFWLDNADRDLEGDDDEELYVSEPYYSWDGWTDERVRALRELWPRATEPPTRWDKVSRDVKELIEARVKEGWS